MNLRKKMTHIWIGPHKPPLHWMNTWPEKHPEWEYEIFTDEMLKSRSWHNQHLIDRYYSMEKWAGVADLIRYELLYEEGGYLPPADSTCLHNTDELFTSPEDYSYTVFEGSPFKKHANFISPIQACNAGNEFVKLLIDTLHQVKADDLNPRPFIATGNQWLSQFVPDKEKHKLIIWPSHYFIPLHFRRGAKRYNGPDKVYAEQMWGNTKKLYD